MEAAPRYLHPVRNASYIAAGCGLVALVVYLLTMAPELTWSPWGTDSGDFISAAYLGRLAHPPGAPLYWFLTRLFVRIPFGNPAWRMNLFSALSASATIGILVLTLKVYDFGSWVAGFSGLSVAFSSLFWSHAIITEVYTLSALCVSVVMLIHAIEATGGRKHPLWLGLATGLTASVHLTTLALCVSSFPKSNQDRFRYLLGLLAGLSLYGGLFLVQPCTQIWGDVCTLQTWWHYVSARLYGGYSFALPVGHIPTRMLALLSTLSKLFTPLGALVVAVGVGNLFAAKEFSPDRTKQRQQVLAYIVVMLAVSIYALLYNTGDSIVYLVPMFPVCGYLLAAGLANVRLPKVPVQVFAVMPVLLLLINWSPVSLANDTDVAQWLDAIMEQLPDRAEVLTQQGRYTFELWYSVEVKDQRRDIVIVDEKLWHYPSYRIYMQSNYDAVPAGEDVRETIRPVCVIDEDEVICD